MGIEIISVAICLDSDALKIEKYIQKHKTLDLCLPEGTQFHTIITRDPTVIECAKYLFNFTTSYNNTNLNLFDPLFPKIQAEICEHRFKVLLKNIQNFVKN